MDKSLVKGLIIGGAVALAAGSIAGYRVLDSGPKYAEVLAAEPIYKTVRTPRKVCRDEVITARAPTRDSKQITGTVIGAVVGGVLGNQVGDGSGQTLATVAGAAGGGYAGNRIQKRMQDGRTVSSTVERCTTVYDSKEKREGFKVRYRLGEQTKSIRMDHDPGERIPVVDGQLVLTPANVPDSKSAASVSQSELAINE
jgi:uncharacterized protein YcfJ